VKHIATLSRAFYSRGIALRKVGLVVLIVAALILSGCQPVVQTAPGVTRLTLWQGVNPPPNRDVLQALVDKFNQTHPSIQVDSLYVGQSDQQMPKILAAIVGNAAPDMLWFAPMITGQLVELEALRSLEDWFSALPIKDQVDPALRESMQFEGHLWSIPFATNNVGIFYRPSLFQTAGITELPRTWAQLRDTAQKLTIPEKGQRGMLLPLGKGEWTVFTWLPFMWSGGGELVADGSTSTREQAIAGPASGEREGSESRPQGDDRPQVQMNNPGAIAALNLWQSLIQDGSVTLSQPERGYELDGFLAGKVAMQLTGPWTLGQLAETRVDFGVMPIPEDTRRATSTGGENLFILKSTPEREKAALVFAEYVLSEEFQTEWAIKTGYLPVNTQSRQSPAYLDFVRQQPAVEVFLAQAQYGRSRPIFPGYNRISESLGRAIEAVLLGEATPEEALSTAQRRIDLVFNR
jgi:multiple sugar transport system substrate-binding protein